MLKCLVHGKLQMICNSILAKSWRESTETEPDLVGTGNACIMKRHTWLARIIHIPVNNPPSGLRLRPAFAGRRSGQAQGAR